MAGPKEDVKTTTLGDLEKEDVKTQEIVAPEGNDVLEVPESLAFGVERVSKTELVTIPANEYRSRQNAKIKMEAAALNSDETIPGGRYLVNDKYVDCDGKEIS